MIKQYISQLITIFIATVFIVSCNGGGISSSSSSSSSSTQGTSSSSSEPESPIEIFKGANNEELTKLPSELRKIEVTLDADADADAVKFSESASSLVIEDVTERYDLSLLYNALKEAKDKESLANSESNKTDGEFKIENVSEKTEELKDAVERLKPEAENKKKIIEIVNKSNALQVEKLNTQTVELNKLIILLKPLLKPLLNLVSYSVSGDLALDYLNSLGKLLEEAKTAKQQAMNAVTNVVKNAASSKEVKKALEAAAARELIVMHSRSETKNKTKLREIAKALNLEQSIILDRSNDSKAILDSLKLIKELNKLSERAKIAKQQAKKAEKKAAAEKALKAAFRFEDAVTKFTNALAVELKKAKNKQEIKTIVESSNKRQSEILSEFNDLAVILDSLPPKNYNVAELVSFNDVTGILGSLTPKNYNASEINDLFKIANNKKELAFKEANKTVLEFEIKAAEAAAKEFKDAVTSVTALADFFLTNKETEIKQIIRSSNKKQSLILNDLEDILSLLTLDVNEAGINTLLKTAKKAKSEVNKKLAGLEANSEAKTLLETKVALKAAIYFKDAVTNFTNALAVELTQQKAGAIKSPQREPKELFKYLSSLFNNYKKEKLDKLNKLKTALDLLSLTNFTTYEALGDLLNMSTDTIENSLNLREQITSETLMQAGGIFDFIKKFEILKQKIVTTDTVLELKGFLISQSSTKVFMERSEELYKLIQTVELSSKLNDLPKGESITAEAEDKMEAARDLEEKLLEINDELFDINTSLKDQDNYYIGWEYVVDLAIKKSTIESNYKEAVTSFAKAVQDLQPTIEALLEETATKLLKDLVQCSAVCGNKEEALKNEFIKRVNVFFKDLSARVTDQDSIEIGRYGFRAFKSFIESFKQYNIAEEFLKKHFPNLDGFIASATEAMKATEATEATEEKSQEMIEIKELKSFVEIWIQQTKEAKVRAKEPLKL